MGARHGGVVQMREDAYFVAKLFDGRIVDSNLDVLLVKAGRATNDYGEFSVFRVDRPIRESEYTYHGKKDPEATFIGMWKKVDVT